MLFRSLLVAGLTSIVRPIPIPAGGHLDLLIVALLSLLLFFVSMTQDRKIIRGEAALLLTGYLSYMVWRSISA